MTVCDLLLVFVSCWGKNMKLIIYASFVSGILSASGSLAQVVEWPHADKSYITGIGGINTEWRRAPTDVSQVESPVGCVVAGSRYLVGSQERFATGLGRWTCWTDPSQVSEILKNLYLPKQLATVTGATDVCTGVAFSYDGFGMSRMFPAGCSGVPPVGVSCTPSDAVIDHGRVAPGAMTSAGTDLSITCTSAVTVRLDLVAERVELGKGVVSVVGIEHGSFIVDPSRLRKVTSTLSVAPGASPGVYSGAALVLLSYE